MKRFLCLSLCLGLMASACKKKYTQDDLDKARAEGKASGKSSATTATKKDKEGVLKACLPQINTMLRANYAADQAYFVLRQTTAYTTTAAAPALLLPTQSTAEDAGLPLAFHANDSFGLGKSAAGVTTNLNAMAKDADVQAQFVDRAGDNKGKGYRTFISGGGTFVNVGIDAADAANTAYDAPGEDAIYKIYDRANTRAEGVTNAAIAAVATLNAANNADARAGWYDCAVDDNDEVTLVYTDTAMA